MNHNKKIQCLSTATNREYVVLKGVHHHKRIRDTRLTIVSTHFTFAKLILAAVICQWL